MRAKGGPKIRTEKEGPIIRSPSTSAGSYENSHSYSYSHSQSGSAANSISRNGSAVNSNSRSGSAASREEFGKGETDDESDEWESAGTSASKNFSNEVSPDNRDSHQQLLVVPFKGGVPQSPPPPPPKNRYVLYIQMQLCESKTLKNFLERPDRHVSIVENMSMFQQIVSGLHHIHSRDLIHRDLKPENIFFTANGSIKIGDFGLSKQFHGKVAAEHKFFGAEVSPHTMGIGTRSYASPEQIRSNFYSAKSDIYSLGIILFEMFNVFETHTERAKVLQELRQGIIPPAMWSKFPDVARFVLCLMDEVPENRPSPSDILRSSFMTLAQGPCSVTSLVVKQREEIEKLQEKIRKLEQELNSGNPT
eukprot:Phypoly_transcript_07957.p1 GENE.Phypoly_transcript_07957~~Phypoly_transcript_07957.p1  ORF type:complete len:400 (+),score=91.98 Phypoly_transcript_07957:114-1202(+)